MIYLTIAKEFMKRGVSSNSNIKDFKQALDKLNVEFAFPPTTDFQTFNILQCIVWLEWCYTNGYEPEFTGELDEMEQDIEIRFIFGRLGLSMENTIREKLIGEAENQDSSGQLGLAPQDDQSSDIKDVGDTGTNERPSQN